MYDSYLWNGWWIAMPFMMIVFWILLFAAIAWLVRGAGVAWRWGGRSHALEILEERYARGEIDKEEFERRRKDLER